jgi:hypothetical protein
VFGLTTAAHGEPVLCLFAYGSAATRRIGVLLEGDAD